jgi:hypothetical protein
VAWDIEYTDEFENWWEGLTSDEQESIAYGVDLLSDQGPALARPYADTVNDSSFANMKELRVQHEGRPYRIFFAFDPRRTGILLIGGEKTGTPRFYEEYIPVADAIYTRYLGEIKK